MWLFAASLHASEATSASYRFASVHIGGGGFVSGLVFQPTVPGLLYARTDVGGAYRWDQARAQWTPLTDWLSAADDNLFGIDSLAVDPGDANRVYLAAGMYDTASAGNAAILRSEDRGVHFQRSDLPFKLGGNELGRGNGERLAVDPHDGRILFFGSRDAGLWRSNDHGAHWSRVDSFPAAATSLSATAQNNWRRQAIGIVFVVFDPSSGSPGRASTTLYAGVSSRETSLFRSTDGGRTWSAVPSQPLGLRPNHMARASNGVYYLSYGDEPGPDSMHDGAVWKYEPTSNQWSDITPLPHVSGQPSGYGWGAVAVDPNHPDVVMTATFAHYTPKDELFRSIDGGAHWQEIFAHSQFDVSQTAWTREHTPHWIASIAIDPHDSDHVWFVTGYGVWMSVDMRNADHGSDVHWQFQDQGLEETVALDLVSPPQGAHLISAVGDLDGYRHDDLSTAPLQFTAPPRYANSESLDEAGRKPAWIVRSGYLRYPFGTAMRAAYSQDGGTHWKAFASEPEKGATEGAGTIAIAADASAVLWFPNGASTAYLTRDFGQHWFAAEGLSAHAHVLSDRVDPQRFYAYDAAAGEVFVSRDGGMHFHVIGGALDYRTKPRDHLSLRADPDNAGVLYAGSRKQGMLRANDNGLLLAHMGELTDVDSFGFGCPAPEKSMPTLFAAGQRGDVQGLYRSVDGGSHWMRIDDDQHRFGQVTHVTGDPRIFGRVYFAGSGRGILYGDPVGAEQP
ncbi:WD40/YVTN/BNR-like repeat-containing protein [Dyella caseinilytica]|uniref:Cellulase n=1 Tax=Dyella caseinilytica TaxID=1849581 RepID=A0ABX7GZB1_9GAMM|nr:cellulase [Dyella caseinilytica]QRN55665.1 cellulase [Dyella caseinilytica]GGA03539.1 cellulase [Dyella caseinilytica]